MLQNEIGMSVMFITHDMGVVPEVADRVVVMLRGKKVEEGPAEPILNSPQHPYTKALLAAVPRLGPVRRPQPPMHVTNVEHHRPEDDEALTGVQPPTQAQECR